MDVANGFLAEFEHWVVVVGTGMLDEEQGRAYGSLGLAGHDVAVEEGLEVVVAVFLDVGGVEDGVDIGQGFQAAGTGLIVYDSDVILACFWIGHHIEAVDEASNLPVAQLVGDGLFEAEDGEGREAAIEFEQLAHVADDDFAIDDLQAVEQGQIEFLADGGIDGSFYLDTTLEQIVEGHLADGLLAEGLVERLAGFMEDVAENAVVDEFFFVVVGLLEVAHITVVEAQLATEVGADGGGTEAAFLVGEAMLQGLYHIGSLVDGLGGAELRSLASTEGGHLHGALDHELEHEARHLARLTIGSGVVVDDGDILGALQQTVEIVLIDGYLVVDGGEAVGLADGVGDKRGVVDASGHVTLVAGEQQHVVEVEVARFEHTHHLKAFGGFAMEGDGGLLDELLEEALEGDGVDNQGIALYQIVEAIEEGVHAEACFRFDRLSVRRGRDGLDDVEEPGEEGGIGGEVLGGVIVGQERGEGMAGHDVEPATTEAPYLSGIAIDLQIDELGDERGHRRLQQGIAGGDIDFLDTLGQTVDHGLQQTFVAEYDGGATTSRQALGREPLGDIAGLDILGGGRDEGHLLWGHLISILIEDGLACLFQATEEHLLYLLQQIEADEGVGVVLEREALVGGHLTVEGAFVAEILRGQLAVEGGVDIADMTPQPQEALFEFAVVIGGEVAKEATNHIALFVREIRHIVEFVDIAQIGKHLIGGRHVFIEVVEVGQEQLSPAVEVVEALVDARTLGEALVELADQQDGVGHLEARVTTEEVADGDIGGTPHGATCQTGEVLVEEERGALVGEHDGYAREVGTISVEQIFCDGFEKAFHTSSILLE